MCSLHSSLWEWTAELIPHSWLWWSLMAPSSALSSIFFGFALFHPSIYFSCVCQALKFNSPILQKHWPFAAILLGGHIYMLYGCSNRLCLPSLGFTEMILTWKPVGCIWIDPERPCYYHLTKWHIKTSFSCWIYLLPSSAWPLLWACVMVKFSVSAHSVQK